jgi:hypothetical protein
MSNFPTCKSCGTEMTIFDDFWWYRCPECGNRVRSHDDGSWTWEDEIFSSGSKRHRSDFELADFCRGGDLSDD